jgi:hypothetical protein
MSSNLAAAGLTVLAFLAVGYCDSTAVDSGRVVQLDRMTVHGDLLFLDHSSVTYLTRPNFKGLYADLPSLLEEVSGVVVRRTGGLGEYADISIRSAESRQVQVYLDGVPLNTATGGAVDLSRIPLGLLNDVTVYKGSAPLELMGNSGGAVLSLNTASSTDVLVADGEVGSYGYNKGGFLARRTGTNAINQMSVEFADTRNDYPFLYDNNTPYNPSDDIDVNKKNSAYTALNAAYAGRVFAGRNAVIDMRVSGSRDSKENFHKFLALAPQEAQTDDKALQGVLSFEKTLSSRAYWKLGGTGRFKEEVFSDPLGTYYLGGAYKEKSSYPLGELSAEAMTGFGRALSLQARASAGYEGYSAENLLSQSNAASRGHSKRRPISATVSSPRFATTTSTQLTRQTLPPPGR